MPFLDADLWVPAHVRRPLVRRLVRTAGSAARTLPVCLRAGTNALLDLVLPPSCPACRGSLGTAGGLCPDCWQTLRFIERPWCERL